MKTPQTHPFLRSTALALCVAAHAFSGSPPARAAEPAASTYGSGKNYKTTIERQHEGELSAEDLHQASLLSSQMLVHLGAASRHCIDGKGENARPEIEKALTLSGIVRKLLPTTTVTTVVKDAQGKEVYRDVQKIQEDDIPLFSGSIAVEVVEPLVEAKKDEAALKGLKLADADVIHTAVLADLGYIERKLARAAQLLNKPEEAAAQLALARTVGVHFTSHKEDAPLFDVQRALELAERMVQEKKYDGARANLEAAKLRLETYRGLVGANEAKPAAELAKEIEKLSGEIEKPGVAEKIRGMWDKAAGWFKREAGQAHEAVPAEKKEAKP